MKKKYDIIIGHTSSVMSVHNMSTNINAPSSTIDTSITHGTKKQVMKTDVVEYSIPSKGTEHYDDYVSYKSLQCHDCYYAAHCDRHRH